MRLEDFKDIAVGLINDALANMHTITIAKVTQVKAKTINCKPVMSRVVNGKKVDLPEFSDVPCINLQGGSSYLHMPTKAGDYCLLLISERCFDGWYNGQDFEKPLEYRMHDYSDSFAVIGINPAGSALTIPDIIEFMGDKLMDGNHEHNGNLEHNGDNTHTGDYIHEGDYNHTGNKLQTGNHTQTGNMAVTGAISATGILSAAGLTIAGQVGVSGSFTSDDGKSITVTNGIITAIV